MRQLVLAVSLLAAVTAPALAHSRHHHVAMPNGAAAFVDLVPAVPVSSIFGTHQGPAASSANPRACIWGVECPN